MLRKYLPMCLWGRSHVHSRPPRACLSASQLPQPETCQQPNSSRSLYRYKNQSSHETTKKARICPDVALPKHKKGPPRRQLGIRTRSPAIMLDYSAPSLVLGRPVLYAAPRVIVAPIADKFKYFWCRMPPWEEYCFRLWNSLDGISFFSRPHVILLAVRACLCTTTPDLPTEATTMEV